MVEEKKVVKKAPVVKKVEPVVKATVSTEEAALSHERDIEVKFERVRTVRDPQGAWIWEDREIK